VADRGGGRQRLLGGRHWEFGVGRELDFGFGLGFGFVGGAQGSTDTMRWRGRRVRVGNC
jgi:hypothetical protein